jgi:hypothetical protein
MFDWGWVIFLVKEPQVFAHQKTILNNGIVTLISPGMALNERFDRRKSEQLFRQSSDEIDALFETW